ncbi:MAG TPA: hypothetical protein PK986_11455 [Spirochaetota bacterium]|nr:outer membrane beta-barrel protein [Spirochaetota bacterium]HQO41077.1 hypothetical protein [Spirochaetota bacterium]
MRNRLLLSVLSMVMILAAMDLSAAVSRKKYFNKPQLGIWYGPVTPIFGTGELLEPDMGLGVFFRYNLPFDSVKLGLDASYQEYKSSGVNELTMFPVYLNALYLLPFDLPVRLQGKAGAGMCHLHMEPDGVNQWEPMFMMGAEVSFPAGKLANIALRVDYIFVYEEYMKDATENGHFINAAISLYFNFNL